MNIETISYLRWVVIFQNIFGINRSFLLNSAKCKFISYILFTLSLSCILGFVIYDEVYTINGVWYVYSVKALAVFEVIYLNISVRKNMFFFHILEKIPDKLLDKTKPLRKGAIFLVALSLVSILIDFMGMNIICLPNSIILMGTIAFGATDSELSLYSANTEIFNIQIERLKESNPATASIVYKRLLLSAICFSQACRNQTTFLVFVTLLMSVIYSSTSTLGKEFVILRIFFIWREVRSLSSIWMFCAAVERTKNLCERLQFRLAENLVFANLDSNYEVILRRLIQCINSMQLQKLVGGARVVTSRLPYKILDWTLNYFIIIVQVYMAYK